MIAVEPVASTTVSKEQASDRDHPDPVTLTEPEHDEQGLLRWASIPAPELG